MVMIPARILRCTLRSVRLTCAFTRFSSLREYAGAYPAERWQWINGSSKQTPDELYMRVARCSSKKDFHESARKHRNHGSGLIVSKIRRTAITSDGLAFAHGLRAASNGIPGARESHASRPRSAWIDERGRAQWRATRHERFSRDHAHRAASSSFA